MEGQRLERQGNLVASTPISRCFNVARRRRACPSPRRPRPHVPHGSAATSLHEHQHRLAVGRHTVSFIVVNVTSRPPCAQFVDVFAQRALLDGSRPLRDRRDLVLERSDLVDGHSALATRSGLDDAGRGVSLCGEARAAKRGAATDTRSSRAVDPRGCRDARNFTSAGPE